MNFGVGLLFLLAFSVNIFGSIGAKEYIRGCYYTNWSQFRRGIWKFMPENIEPDMCSHIFFAFATMDEKFLIQSIENNDADLYARVNSIKEKQPELKTLLSFGGHLFAQSNGPLMRRLLDSDINRKIFVRSAFVFVRLHKFDGFDFNWYPDADTKDNYVKLIQEFRDAIDSEAKETNRPMLLTAAVPPHVDMIKAGYDVKLADSLDWMNVNSFDYHGGWENETGFNTPLFDPKSDDGSISDTFAYLTDKLRIPKNKLVMGFATYGRGWTLPSTSAPNTIPSPAKGPSPVQAFTNAEGFASYFEICNLIENQKYTEGFDEVRRVPFVFKDGVWIAYDNTKSFDERLDWLIKNDFAGAFVWSFDLDDFVGNCPSSKGKYPLIKTIKAKLVKKG